MSRSIFWNGIALCLTNSLLCCGAAAAPLNKTVTVGFTSFAPANCADGSTNKYSRDVSQQIYISTQGRVFARTVRRAGSARRDSDDAPSGSGRFSLSGDKVVGTFAQVSGAAQETITFDQSYQSCTANVIVGTESGKPYVWTNLVGVKCTATGKHVISNVSCAVRDGNAFAN